MSRLGQCSVSMEDWGNEEGRKFRKQIEYYCKDMRVKLRCNSNSEAAENITKYREMLSELLTKEEIYWKQRSKEFWLAERDSNTRYFHAMANARRRTNTIHRLMHEEGYWVETAEGLCAMAKTYFSLIYLKLPPRGLWHPL